VNSKGLWKENGSAAIEKLRKIAPYGNVMLQSGIQYSNAEEKRKGS